MVFNANAIASPSFMYVCLPPLKFNFIMIVMIYHNKELLTTADFTANVSTADVTTANVLVLGYGL